MKPGPRAFPADLGASPSRHGARAARSRGGEALGALGDRRAIEPLTAALEDAEPRVPSAAATALGLADDEQQGFRPRLTDYVRLYAFLAQVLTFGDADLEKLYVSARHLRRLLPANRRSCRAKCSRTSTWGRTGIGWAQRACRS